MKERVIESNLFKVENELFDAAGWTVYSTSPDCPEKVGSVIKIFEGKKIKASFYERMREGTGYKSFAYYVELAREMIFISKKRKEKLDTPHGLMIGDILAHSWGWEQTNIDFYEVVRVMPKSVEIKRRNNEIVQVIAHSTVKVVPSTEFYNQASVVVRANGNRINTPNSCGGMSKWNGSPMIQTSYA